MLPSAYRLKRKKQIEKVFSVAKTRRSGFLLGKFLANGLDNTRFCFVVSKRISNKAVVRNKIKRYLRAAVMVELSHIKPGFDCVVITLPGIENKNYKEISVEIYRLLGLIGIL